MSLMEKKEEKNHIRKELDRESEKWTKIQIKGKMEYKSEKL